LLPHKPSSKNRGRCPISPYYDTHDEKDCISGHSSFQ
jgi:hypothetical protein